MTYNKNIRRLSKVFKENYYPVRLTFCKRGNISKEVSKQHVIQIKNLDLLLTFTINVYDDNYKG